MTRRQRFAMIAGLCAAVACMIFFAIALSGSVYAPGARALQQKLASTDNWQNPLLSSYGFGGFLYKFVRKAYSVIAFTIIGGFAAPIFPRRRRTVACTLVVAGFSTLIEIGQWITYNNESNASRVFDIGCGAFGGFLGASIWNAITGRAKRKT